MPTVATPPNATYAARILNGEATRKAAKTPLSAAAAKAVDTNGDGKVSHLELKQGLDRLDLASRAQVETAVKSFDAASSGGVGRTVLLVGTMISTMAFYLGRVGNPIAIGAAVLSMAGMIGGMVWDNSRRKAAEPALFEVVNPLLEQLK